MLTLSERLFEQFCHQNGIPIERIPAAAERTPDYRIMLGNVFITCEVKQIDPNPDDLKDIEALKLRGRTDGARLVRNRFSAKLKNVSGQLRTARDKQEPTLLVVYDNTPFRLALDHEDVLEGMFGELTYQEDIDPSGAVVASRSFFGKNKRVGPECNASISAIGVLRAIPDSRLGLHVYHNPFAAVVLPPSLLEPYPCSTRLKPDDTHVDLWG